jgi:hypothetical protein
MARPERFELPTTWFVARYSIQLSYGRLICYLSCSFNCTAERRIFQMTSLPVKALADFSDIAA